MYHIGQTYTSSAFAKTNLERKKLAPKSENLACFAFVNPMLANGSRSEIESLSKMSEEELMLDVEILRVCDTAFRNSKLA